MIKLPIAKLVGNFMIITDFGRVVSDISIDKAGSNLQLPQSYYAEIYQAINILCETCEIVGLLVTLSCLRDFRNVFSKIRQVDGSGLILANDLSMFASYTSLISGCLPREVETKHVFSVPFENIKLLEPTEPLFSGEVRSKFPSAVFDIDESCKCLALGRYTACVFHLMRVMEIALHSVYACLAIPAPITGNDKTWGSIIQKIRNEYRGRKNFSEMALFQEFHSLLDAVKDAWRNGTMHVENKYTEEEAKVILQTVKGYMIKLASRMDEKGYPTA
jgi:HEPN domain-containing protein